MVSHVQSGLKALVVVTLFKVKVSDDKRQIAVPGASVLVALHSFLKLLNCQKTVH